MKQRTLTFDNATIESVSFIATADPPRWKGQLQLPNQNPIDLIIFNIAGEFRAFPASCPHENYNLTLCPLRDGDTLICPAHQFRINALPTTGLVLNEHDGQFMVCLKTISLLSTAENNTVNTIPAESPDLTRQLREEIEKLRLSNRKQEKQIHIIAQAMDTVINESEREKTKFKEKADHHQALSRFVNRIMDTLDNLIFVIDNNGLIKRLNSAVERELKVTEKELLGTAFDALLLPEERRHLTELLPVLPWKLESVFLESVRINGSYSGEHMLLGNGPEASRAIFWLKSSLLHTEKGKLEGAVISGLNITEIKTRETQLKLSAKVFENSGEAIFITDPQGVIKEVNSAFCQITGYQRTEVIGQNTRLLKSHLHDLSFYQSLWQTLLNVGSWKGEIWDRRKNGDICPMLLSINAVTDESGQLTHYVAISADISQQKQTEQELKQLAHYDVLTKLPNRFLFKDRFEQEILLAERNNTRLALFFLDLDRFKDINDTLGHWAGDMLLQALSTRIQGCLRKSDTVARMGGDEFTIILPGLTGIADATELAQLLIDEIMRPVQIKDHTTFVSVSIGIAIYPDDGEDFYTLTKHADIAMFASKAKGRGIFQYFETGMNETAHQRLLLENALRLAIEKQEFELYYQPKADGTLSRLAGAEALVRWRRPGFGIVSPDHFIALTEETDLIIPLGNWILETACLQANIWAHKLPGFRVAINISPKQLLAENFIDVLEGILAKTGTHPEWITLEVTESLIMHDIQITAERLQKIRNRGIHIAMDDFGTGYSSLSYLQKLPINSLKIDRSFIQAYKGDPTSKEAAFIKTIVSLGQTLNMTVVAEGVETEVQLILLQAYGCHEIQGYYLSPPMPAEQFQHCWIDHGLAELSKKRPELHVF
ncbi:MAG: EAL domain-containing protein [Methylococcaceae bacterium]|jgi:diguanylate cyclase (GGDEF)-like protein/PAS domain S-box-containing protein